MAPIFWQWDKANWYHGKYMLIYRGVLKWDHTKSVFVIIDVLKYTVLEMQTV